MPSTVGKRVDGSGGLALLIPSAAAAEHHLVPAGTRDVVCCVLDLPAGPANPGWRGKLLATPCAVGSGRQTLPWFSIVLLRMRVDPLRFVINPAVLRVLQSTSTTLLNSKVWFAVS